MVLIWTSLLGSHRNLRNLLEVLNKDIVQVVLAKFEVKRYQGDYLRFSWRSILDRARWVE